MPAVVQLKDIVDALEVQFDELWSFVDRESGQVETFEVDLLRAAADFREGDDELDPPGEQQDEWELAKQVLFNDRFVKLPTKRDVHEWAIMEEFSTAWPSERIRDQLVDAIHGAGAFRTFKSTIRRLRIEQNWFAFRTQALTEIARDWCEEHDIAWQ